MMEALALTSSSFSPSHRRRPLIEDPRTFLVTISRQQWRDITFGALIDTADDGRSAVWVDGPVLVFADNRQCRALELQGRLEHAVDDYHRALAKLAKSDAPGRAAAAKTVGAQQKYVRRCHIALINLAIGYTWPRNPPGYIEFAE